MLVWTVARSSVTPGSRATRPRPGSARSRWSSASRSTISVSATMPGAAITPAWRMPPPRILRIRRARSTNAADPQISDPTGAASPFDRHSCTDDTCRVQSVTGRPEADRGVEQPRAVEVDGQAVLARDGRHVGEVRRREDRAAAPVVRVLEADHARRRPVVEVVVVRRQVDRRLERVERQRAVRVRRHRVQHHAAERRRRPVLVVVDVRLVAEDHFLPALAVRQQRRQVPHRPAGDEEAGLHAGHPRRQRLELVDGRVLAEHVVAERRRRHRLPHRRRRQGHRVASQIYGHWYPFPAYGSRLTPHGRLSPCQSCAS